MKRADACILSLNMYTVHVLGLNCLFIWECPCCNCDCIFLSFLPAPASLVFLPLSKHTEYDIWPCPHKLCLKCCCPDNQVFTSSLNFLSHFSPTLSLIFPFCIYCLLKHYISLLSESRIKWGLKWKQKTLNILFFYIPEPRTVPTT